MIIWNMWFSALAMLHLITVYRSFNVCCSGVECHYIVFFLYTLILILVSYFIMMIISITDMFMSMAIPFELQIYAFWN